MHPVLCIIWLSYQRPSARKNTIHQYFLNILYAKCLIYKHSINNMSQGCEMMIFSFLVLASLTSHSHSKFRFHFGTLFSELTNISKGCLKFQYQISLRTHARVCVSSGHLVWRSSLAPTVATISSIFQMHRGKCVF